MGNVRRDLTIFAAILFLVVTVVCLIIHTRASLIAAIVNLGLFIFSLYMLKPYLSKKVP